MKVYPDKATFGAELDRLTGICLKLKIRAQKEGVEIETALHKAAAAGEIDPEDFELVRLAFGGDRAC